MSIVIRPTDALDILDPVQGVRCSRKFYLLTSWEAARKAFSVTALHSLKDNYVYTTAFTTTHKYQSHDMFVPRNAMIRAVGTEVTTLQVTSDGTSGAKNCGSALDSAAIVQRSSILPHRRDLLTVLCEFDRCCRQALPTGGMYRSRSQRHLGGICCKSWSSMSLGACGCHCIIGVFDISCHVMLDRVMIRHRTKFRWSTSAC